MLFETAGSYPFDLILLDIDLGGGKLSGLELARKIREMDVRVSLAFLTNYPGHVFEGYEPVRHSGNLIDNAMESCEKLEEGERFLRLYIGVLKQQLYISISNATTETVRKIDAAYVSAKRGNHGHGLKHIDRVVKKYGGYVNWQNEPGVFATEVLLPL